MFQRMLNKSRERMRNNPHYVFQRPMGEGGISQKEWDYLRQFDWYYNHFTLHDKFQFLPKDVPNDTICSAPLLFYPYSNSFLKIFCHKNLNAIGHVIGTQTIISYTLIGCIAVLFIFLFKQAFFMEIAYAILTVAILILLPAYSLCILSLKLTKDVYDVPYAIFDGHQNKMIIRGKTGDEDIAYDRISFQLIAIDDSMLHGVIEMNISYDAQGLPPKKIITDIFETPQQAHSILKTYFTILSGDQQIFNETLKPHPVTLREFNLPPWEALKAYRQSTWRWFTCVLPHYFCFRLLHGHPLSVLGAYAKIGMDNISPKVQTKTD